MPKKPKPLGGWKAKMLKPAEPELMDVPPSWQARMGEGKMLIPTPRLVDALVRKVPKNRLVTIEQIRERLAADFGMAATCPLTTGIFLRIAAEAAEECVLLGETEITPYWRVIRADGSLNEKFPGGIEAQSQHLAQEGHTIDAPRGNKMRVRDFRKSLAIL